MRHYLSFILCFFSLLATKAQTIYHTEVFTPKRIKSLQVKQPNKIFSTPIIALGSDEQIEINFDDLTPHYSRYAYQIIHCNADWSESQLSQAEYMQGFQGLTIDDFANSFNTTVQYVNYQLLLPNEEIQFKVSGNYTVRIYDEEQPDKTILTACFSVVDPQIEISGEVKGNTLIDTYQHHQQINFTVHKKNFPIAFPQRDLKIRVLQNNRQDMIVSDIQPSTILGDQIVYENCRNLIFPAGNEYRRMEFLTHKYNGMHVESISFFNPYYHIELTPDVPTNMNNYVYDQDQNGRFYPSCSRCNDPNTEADYYIVHFALGTPEVKNGKIYLNGDFVQNLFTEESEMIYNPDSYQYEKALLIKQGNYNYQYLFVNNDSDMGDTRVIEGNFHETENEYTIYVYYAPSGARYDKLIGTQTLRTTQQEL